MREPEGLDQEFSLTLAALYYNENSEKVQAATREGNLEYSVVFPKQKKGEVIVKKKSRLRVLMVNLINITYHVITEVHIHVTIVIHSVRVN